MSRTLRRVGCALAVAFAAMLFAGPGLAAASFDPPAAPAKASGLVAAVKAVEAKEWTKAIGLLERIVAESPSDADAYNYLGYSHRKLGNRDKALANYMRALEVDANHRGANEYLGELYLDMNDLTKAEDRLARLSRICGPRCTEYRDLREQIEKFKAGKPRG